MAHFKPMDKEVVFDLQAIRMAERTLETGIHNAIQERLGPTTLITILWAGLSRRNRQLSYRDVEKKVEKLIKERKLTMRELNAFVVEELIKSGAFSGYMDDDDDEGGEKAPLASPDSSESG